MTDLRLFHWQAMTSRGEVISGLSLCNHKSELPARLQQRDLLLVYSRSGRRLSSRQWNVTRRILFFSQLATLLSAGLTLVQGLELLGEEHPDLTWRALIGELRQAILQGITFSQALRQWQHIFPPAWAALIETGELTGQLAGCCQRLADQQARQHQLQSKMLKALRYPVFILAVVLLITFAMLIWVLPEFSQIYASFNAPLPAFTAAVIALSQWLQRWSGCLMAGWLLLLAGGVYLHRSSAEWRKKEQRLLLRLPLVAGIWQGNQLSQIFNTLALAQRTGLTLLQGLNIAAQTLDSSLWREAMSHLAEQVAQGNMLHHAIHKHPLFTPLCYQLIKTGEEAGALEEMLYRLAEWHEEQTRTTAINLTAAPEPIMMLMTGVIVGALVIAMYLPVFGLGDVMQ